MPTRVINAVCAEDPSIIYSIGLSYGTAQEIFSAAMKQLKVDSAQGKRGDKLDEVCQDLAEPVIAFVGSDNNYGGADPKYEQKPLEKVTPEITQAIKNMKSQKKD